MSTVLATNDAAIWSRMVAPALSVEAAQYFLAMQFSDADKARMHDLAERNQARKLTPTDADELATFLRVGRLIDILQSKARRTLRANGIEQRAS